jgi:hypothetical protein
VVLLHAVQVDVKEEARVRLKFLDLLADEHAVCAENDVLSTGENLCAKTADFGVQHRFTATDGDGWGATFIYCL